MLVISQKEGEELKLGADITIRVLAISKGRVKLGISAPEQLKVARLSKMRNDEESEEVKTKQ